MTQFDGFDRLPGRFETNSDGAMGCVLCETMLPEAVDGTLTAEEQRAFDAHVAGCTLCSQELAEARRGAAWLSMLKSKPPEPPVGLLERILADTSGAVAGVVVPVVAPAAVNPLLRDEAAQEWGAEIGGRIGRGSSGGSSGRPSVGWRGSWAAVGSQMRVRLSEAFSFSNGQALLQPRLAMTAAMAFFSLALTLNLLGVRVHELRASSFTPSRIQRTLADAGASATRKIVNTRAVYQMESRVSELRGNDEQ